MFERKKTKRPGFTLAELIVGVAMVIIVALGVAVVLANSSKAYQVTYNKVYADVVTDAFVARRLFDSIIRKSSTNGIVIGDNGQSVEAHYYSNSSAAYLDRYARFFTYGLELKVEHGTLTQGGIKEMLTVVPICSNVSSCKFVQSGSSVRMVLNLDNEQKSNLVVTSANLHN